MSGTFEIETKETDLKILEESLTRGVSFECSVIHLEERFDAFMKERSNARGNETSGMKCDEDVVNIVLRCGISARWRRVLWWEWSGAKREMQNSGRSYGALVRDAEEASVSGKDGMQDNERQINLDMERTFPDHPHYVAGGSGLGALRRVLLAFAFHHPSIGYLQGMNFIAAVLLLVFDSEQEAFWILSVFIGKVLPPFLSERLEGLKRELERFSQVVHDELPQTFQKMAEFGLDISFIIPKWFLCAFAATLPLDLVLKIWDILVLVSCHDCDRIIGGSREVIKRCAWALLLSLNKKILSASDAGEIGEIFREAHVQVQDPQAFLQLAFGGPSPTVMRNLCQSQSLTFAGPPMTDSPHRKTRQIRSPSNDLHPARSIQKMPPRSPLSPSTKAAWSRVRGKALHAFSTKERLEKASLSPFTKAMQEILKLTPARYALCNRTNSIPEEDDGIAPVFQEGMELDDLRLSGTSPNRARSRGVARSLQFERS